MGVHRSVLLVAPTPLVSRALGPALMRAGYHVTTVKKFEAARASLKNLPPLSFLITELKLGEYNGLQLALRCRSLGIPAIVIADQTYEQDIEQFGAVWVSPETASGEEVLTLMTRLLPKPVPVVAGYEWQELTPQPSAMAPDDYGPETVLH